MSLPTMRSIQASVLITYFLMNDNHASDGWAFAGILIRQAYSMGLNRDPSITVPWASSFEQQQRRKLWQAVFLQDTFLTIILKLPPTATHFDVKIEEFTNGDDASKASTGPTDGAYIAAMWSIAILTQERICSPRALDHPICSSARDKSSLLSKFANLYRSVPAMLRTVDDDSMDLLSKSNERLLRQILFLTSNYFHCVMLVQADEGENTPYDTIGTLDAAHQAMNAFFLLHRLLPREAYVWYHFQHRAFAEAVSRAPFRSGKFRTVACSAADLNTITAGSSPCAPRPRDGSCLEPHLQQGSGGPVPHGRAFAILQRARRGRSFPLGHFA